MLKPLLVSMVVLGWLSGADAQNTDPVATARAALEQARSRYAAARSALEGSYAQMEREHQEVAVGRELKLKRQVLDRLAPIAEQLEAVRHELTGAVQDRKAKARALEQLRTTLEPSLAEIGLSSSLTQAMVQS